MPESTENRVLTELLREQIAREEGIPFAEFMRQCLYHPAYGYYMTGRQRIGKSGDFFTSSSVHTLFGRLIARQLVQMAELLGEGPFQVFEQGGGEGYLALDILDALAAEAPAVYARLDYVLIELSPVSRRRQSERLAGHAEKVRWSDENWSLDSGCLLTNELLDAFPVHLVEKHQGRLQEVFVVNAEKNRFGEELRELSTRDLADHFDWLGVQPVAGNRCEVNLAAPRWMRETGKRLGRGFVLTIDYGYPALELYAPHRRSGTLMCYHRHQADEDPYEKPGEKDITAHVDFTALQKAGAEAGLQSLWFGEQYRFLMALGFVEELLRLQERTADEKEARALRLTLKNLIMPEAGMGETFKVLVQGKQVDQPQLLCARALRDLPFPGMGF